MAPSWKEIAQLKQRERAERIALASKLLEEKGSARDESGNIGSDQVYLSSKATGIVKNIENGTWTAVQVVSAYIRRAILAHEKTNCLTEILFEEALKEATALDSEFAATRRLKGPLHGVPMTFKDCFEVEGTDATVGFTQWAHRPSTTSAVLVQAARAQGAIILAKTNVPQAIFSLECSNPLFGRTLNPYSAAHTTGGSSGGEAAMLALDASALGIGTDIGGSLRTPAGYCGVFSLKPGAGRISNTGTVATIPGFESLRSVSGPMARSCEDLELACRALFGVPGEPHELDVPLPFKDPVPLPSKLRFGYYSSDSFIKSTPASVRAVTETVEALRKQGHECIEFDPFLAVDAMVTFASILSADAYKTMLSHLGPDPIESGLFLPTLGPRLPGFVRNAATWIVRTFIGDEIFARCLEVSRAKSVRELYALQAQRDDFRKRWYKDIWGKYQFDGIIAPVQASPALPHGASATLSPLAAMAILYNTIDSPVGVVPVTRVGPEFDALPARDAWANEKGHGSSLLEHDLYFKASIKGADGRKHTVYDVEAMKGLPVGIQIVGKSGEDEKVLQMMKVVDAALGTTGQRNFGPGTLKA